jgi:DNA-binding response OmpR family regulator
MPGDPVLVVDDTPVGLKLTRLLLAREGYDVRTAESAEEALTALDEFRPMLILTDVQLPGIDGLEMTRRIKANPRTKDITIVALSARAMMGDEVQARAAGCDGYITKPIDTNKLPSQIRNLMDRRRALIAESASSSSQSQPGFGVSKQEMEALRRQFLDEGEERCHRLLGGIGNGFDARSAARQMHQWVGSAGLLGFGEICKLARSLEQKLETQPSAISEARELLTNLALTFADLRQAKLARIPDHIAKAIAGGRIAMVGFEAKHADRMCEVLGGAGARLMSFGAGEDPNSEVIRQCDLIIVDVHPGTMDCGWLKRDAPCGETRLVFAGERQYLLNLHPVVQTHATDFIVNPSEPEEILMRCALALSRQVRPQADPVPAAVPSAAPQAVGGETGKRAIAVPRVVVADDDSVVVSVVGTALRNFGMTCHFANNGAEALRLIREEKPHAAVLDVNMPELDGYRVLAAVRAENLPVRVVLLTSRQREDDVLRGFQTGADDYLIKPFSPLELIARLRRLLGQ